MIARHWRGWTEVRDADVYESLFKDKVLPSLRRIEGYRGGYILRYDGPQEVEFVVVNFFDSQEPVKRFAGPDYSVPVFEPEARRLLRKIEPGLLFSCFRPSFAPMPQSNSRVLVRTDSSRHNAWLEPARD